MKHFKRLGLYKASNVSFNPETCTALSYDWWVFVKRIKGKVVFNGYRYSVSTARHQRKVRTLLRELGIKIDIEVSFRASLSGYETLRALRKAEEKMQNDLMTKQLNTMRGEP